MDSMNPDPKHCFIGNTVKFGMLNVWDKKKQIGRKTIIHYGKTFIEKSVRYWSFTFTQDQSCGSALIQYVFWIRNDCHFKIF